jgi:hypothetical protein
MAAGKSKRTSKTSKGVHGGGGKMNYPNGLSQVQKVLMGKGMLVNVKQVSA